jgi:hypothetical protein
VFFSLPREIARALPATVGIYNALGIEVEQTGFRIVATQTQEIANGIPIIVIKGELINETDSELDAPAESEFPFATVSARNFTIGS